MGRWALAMMAVGILMLGCGRETTHGDPPPGGWENGATNAKSFSGPATPQFVFKDLAGPGERDAAGADQAGGEDVGGPLTYDIP